MSDFLRHTGLVAGRELRQLLATPLLWVLTGVFFLAGSFVFVALLIGFSDPMMRETNSISGNVNVAVIHDLFYILHYFLLIQAPLLTMRAFAEERRQGTLPLLLTTPASEWSLVLGKFLANTGALVIYIALTLVFALITMWLSEPEWLVLATCYTALLLSAAAYVALGIFFSSITESQVVAAILSYVVLFLMLVSPVLTDVLRSPTVAELARHLTLQAHIEGFLEGNIAIVDAAYFILFAGVFLFLTVRLLESTRWRS